MQEVTPMDKANWVKLGIVFLIVGICLALFTCLLATLWLRWAWYGTLF